MHFCDRNYLRFSVAHTLPRRALTPPPPAPLPDGPFGLRRLRRHPSEDAAAAAALSPPTRRRCRPARRRRRFDVPHAKYPHHQAREWVGTDRDSAPVPIAGEPNRTHRHVAHQSPGTERALTYCQCRVIFYFPFQTLERIIIIFLKIIFRFGRSLYIIYV